MRTTDIMRERDYKLKVITDWEREHYPLDKNYKYNILSMQPLASITIKLHEMGEWCNSGGVARFEGL